MYESALVLADFNMIYLVCVLTVVALGLGVNLLIVTRKKRQMAFAQQEMIDKMKKRIESQEVSSYLLFLLKGRMTKLSEREQELELKLSLSSGSFALVGCYVPQKEEKPEKDELDFFVVDNVFSELMEGEMFYRVEDGRFMYYLFCIPDEGVDQWRWKTKKQAGYLCEFLKKHFGMDISVAISAVEPGISQAKHMYQSVMETFEYSRIVGESGVIHTEELRESGKSSQLQHLHVTLTQAVEHGKTQEALLASGQMFGSMENMPLIVQRIRMLEAFQAVADSYNTYIRDTAKQIQFLQWLEGLLNADGTVRMKEQFDEMLHFACNRINERREAEDRSIVQAVRKYVENNYADCSLNLNSIAGALGRNSRYLSKVFKEETGEGILDYVNELRISKASKLLSKGTYSVETVGEMVGYASTRTFRRTFTKIVGTTPGNFL